MSRVLYFLDKTRYKIIDTFIEELYNPVFDSKKIQTPLEALFYKGFTAVLLCF